MTNASAKKPGGFTGLELVVALVVVMILTGVMLGRVREYNAKAEMIGVEQLIRILRIALTTQETSARVSRAGPAAILRLAEANPFDLLEHKPENYLGEYYSPELEKMPRGNWLFDRRDKTLVYLPDGYKSFPSPTSKFLKFKVEFKHVPIPGGKYGPNEVPSGLTIKQIEGQANTDDLAIAGISA